MVDDQASGRLLAVSASLKSRPQTEVRQHAYDTHREAEPHEEQADVEPCSPGGGRGQHGGGGGVGVKSNVVKERNVCGEHGAAANDRNFQINLRVQA